MSSHLIRNDLLGPPLPYISSAQGSWLIGESGERYLDAASGAVVTSIGHAHPRVVEAIANQAAQVTFTHRGAFGGRNLDALAERLCSFTGYDGAWFVNSGSEAMEAAIQFALQYHAERGHPERTWFLSPASATTATRWAASHCRVTPGATSPRAWSTTSTLCLRRTPFVTPAAARAGVHRRTPRRSTRRVRAARGQAGRRRHRASRRSDSGGDHASGRFPARPAPLCDEFGALLIVDEVMTGLGRVGAPMAGELFGIRADIAAVGKGLGAGYVPIAAVLLRHHVITALEEGSARILGGHTYAGSPLAAAAALAVLSVLEDEKVLERARDASARLEGLLTRRPTTTRSSPRRVASECSGLSNWPRQVRRTFPRRAV